MSNVNMGMLICLLIMLICLIRKQICASFLGGNKMCNENVISALTLISDLSEIIEFFLNI